MGFSYHQFDKGQPPPIEYIVGKTGENFAVGEAMKVADGAMTKCGASETPTHICVAPRLADGTVGGTRVHRDIVYAAPLSAAGTGLKLGDRVTISADAMGVTATTAAGIAEIVRLDGKGVGDLVFLRF